MSNLPCLGLHSGLEGGETATSTLPTIPEVTSQIYQRMNTQDNPNPESTALAAARQVLQSSNCSKALENATSDTTSGQKRKFGWFLSDYIPQEDTYNQRNADSSLKDLGVLPRNLYMLIPMSCTAKVCPLEDVGAGCDKYQVGIPDIAGVYALAKDQAKNITTNPNEQIKWAVLRFEAFIAGWYDKQKHCLRADAPKDSIRIMLTDMEQILKYANQAWVLCGFIPFFIEFNFRTNSTTFTSQTLTEYKQKAEKFARSAQLSVSLDYMKADVLFGDAFRWIGVSRPMNVLKSNNPYIPNVFLVRKHAAPAGQAMIASANAVINSLKGANLWAPIKVKGGYNDEIIETLAGNIYKDPWKYHQLASSYGLGGLNQAELDAIKDARDLVVRVAPVLQAYMDTFLKSSDLGKVKVLYKHALRSPHFYIIMKQKFQSILRRKPMNLAEAFAVYAFEDAPTGGNV